MPKTPRAADEIRPNSGSNDAGVSEPKPTDRPEDADEVASGLRRRVPLFGLDIEASG